MRKKITMEAFIELEEGESIVKFVAKTLKNPPAPLKEVEMKVPKYTMQDMGETPQ